MPTPEFSISPTGDQTECEACNAVSDDCVCIGVENGPSLFVCSSCLTDAITAATEEGKTTVLNEQE